jgi:propionyl-CoA carboxylase alpha chain
MFRKILVANRGEIACRIMASVQRMGIATVAVYSDADKDALHVERADEAVHIGASPAASSYLSIDNIVRACRETGADAVHPGYGFLSEQATFAQALEAAGIAFVGPNARAIASMGDKIESKRLARAANVSVVPGFVGEISDATHASALAEEIGWPVILKASAGGGGKGMRIAHAAGEVAEAFARAKSEAKSSFGDDRIFIEKYIVEPRHIEIQILGDKHGHVVWLGERECSIQRRNQKVIEEAPSPLLDEATRRRMGEQAVALAKAVDYDSAGTVEFVADRDRNFYFLEMNTRLQVEHPVTELVTGVDLVEQMVRVAAGEQLTIRQSDVHLRGWAIESRIYAEDPARDFLPSTGRLSIYQPPPAGHRDGVVLRIDSGVVEGSEISVWYDPLIAKLVTHAGDRMAAIDAQARALDAFAIEGIRQNLSFLSAVMQNPRWRAGQLSTAFIAEEFPNGLADVGPQAETAHLMAVAAAFADWRTTERNRLISGQAATRRSSLLEPARSVMLDAVRWDIRVEETEAGLAVHFDDDGNHVHHVESEWIPGASVWRGVVDGEELAMRFGSGPNGFALAFRGALAKAQVYTRRQADLLALMPARRIESGVKTLLCPMPGHVVAVLVAPGQSVQAGETLCVVEAMKMENTLRADAPGVIAEVFVTPGESLAVDAPILRFA